jgi:hypothetical protein
MCVVLEDGVGAVALDAERDLLEAATFVRARAELVDLEAAPLRVAGEHPVEVAGPERGLVAADALADLEDDILPVGRVGRCHREPELRFEGGRPLLELGHELAQVGVGAGGGEIVAHGPPVLREAIRRFELLQAPPDLRRLAAVVVDVGVRHALLRLGVRALELVDQAVERGGHARTRVRPVAATATYFLAGV